MKTCHIHTQTLLLSDFHDSGLFTKSSDFYGIGLYILSQKSRQTTASPGVQHMQEILRMYPPWTRRTFMVPYVNEAFHNETIMFGISTTMTTKSLLANEKSILSSLDAIWFFHLICYPFPDHFMTFMSLRVYSMTLSNQVVRIDATCVTTQMTHLSATGYIPLSLCQVSELIWQMKKSL